MGEIIAQTCTTCKSSAPWRESYNTDAEYLAAYDEWAEAHQANHCARPAWNEDLIGWDDHE
jgi:hypothetical protein